jgi:hypothetical protein
MHIIMNYSKKALLVASLLLAGVISTQAQLTFNTTSTGSFGPDFVSSQNDFLFDLSSYSTEIGSLSLTVSVSYVRANDLTATLISPGGQSATVFDLTAGSNASTVTFSSTVFSDGGSSLSVNDSNIGSGPFAPSAAFSAFSGLSGANVQGNWTLRFNDNDAINGDSGNLTSATLSITPVPEPATFAFVFGLGALGFAAFRRMRKA